MRTSKLTLAVFGAVLICGCANKAAPTGGASSSIALQLPPEIQEAKELLKRLARSEVV